MKLALQIIDVELVEPDIVGVTLSDGTAVLISLEEILSLEPPPFAVLSDEA